MSHLISVLLFLPHQSMVGDKELTKKYLSVIFFTVKSYYELHEDESLLK